MSTAFVYIGTFTLSITSGGSVREPPGTHAPPLSPNSFIFHAVFSKRFQNNKLAHSLSEVGDRSLWEILDSPLVAL